MTLVTINYQGATGVELSVLDGPAGCCLAADPRKYVGPTPLPGGRTAYFLDNEPQFGGPILWWQQDGAYIAVSGPHLIKDDLVKIASGMSNTATP